MPITGYMHVKTFCATQTEHREQLGETVTAWLAAHDQLEVVAAQVLQSSDTVKHALSIVLFLRPKAPDQTLV